MTAFGKYQGTEILGGRLKINGLSAQLAGPLPVGRAAYLVVEVETGSVEHQWDKKVGGWVQIDKPKIVRSTFMDRYQAEAILNEADEARADGQDGENGEKQPTLLDPH